jgi:hypothetical protein
MKTLTAESTFNAMRLFLEEYYQRTQSEGIAGLLGDLRALPDGKPVDPAAWDDWIRCVERTAKV